MVHKLPCGQKRLEHEPQSTTTSLIPTSDGTAQAARIYSQIRRGAPLREEWDAAFADGRFAQVQPATDPSTGVIICSPNTTYCGLSLVVKNTRPWAAPVACAPCSKKAVSTSPQKSAQAAGASA